MRRHNSFKKFGKKKGRPTAIAAVVGSRKEFLMVVNVRRVEHV